MKTLLDKLKGQEKKSMAVSGLKGSSRALLATRLAHKLQRPVVLITASEEQASALFQDMQLLSNLPLLHYPGFDIPPYTPLSPDPTTVASRLSTLYRLLNINEPYILVVPAEALLRRILPKETLSNLAELVIRGEDTDQAELVRRLLSAGYEKVSLVQNSGEISLRGGILDVFPPHPGEIQAGNEKATYISENFPIRLDFFGDTVESIRFFDPISQRSLQELEEFTVLPVSDILYCNQSDETSPATEALRASRELGWDPDETDFLVDQLNMEARFPGIEFFLPLFHESPASPLEYVQENALLLITDPVEINSTIELTWERITANHQESIAARQPSLIPPSVFLAKSEFAEQLQSFSTLSLGELVLTGVNEEDLFLATTPENEHQVLTGNYTLLAQELEIHRRQKGLLPPLADQINDWLTEGETVLLACRSDRHAEQLAEFLTNHQLSVSINATTIPADLNALAQDKVNLFTSSLSAGFHLVAEKVHFLSESELFGEKRIGKKQKRPANDSEPVSFEELRAGDIVVHLTHGLGSYGGLANMNLSGIPGDFLQIKYQGGDKLYVPVDRLNTVHKYKGLSDQQPKLDKLGGKAWTKAKNKVKEAVWKVARELLDIYARREVASGRRFSMPDQMYHELEESFPFDETPGQLKAINDVIDDLTSDKVTDRLVCGDVGYGKTEVAIRAAFKVIADGCQVAVLVPTTVLAEQHTSSFRERLEGFAVQVGSLNRFRPAAEQRKTLAGLKDGSIDLVIGTHRLLSKDVSFRKLGLLIIDEEHRFGVKHKEQVKKIRAGVDVLTLTATPIPRTLQMSLLGVRDLSVISSPPRHRRSVKTFVAKFDDLVIKEAISREVQRGGQVFVVHNRVQSIHEMARRVQNLKPGVKIGVAHGQMPGRTLEEIMVKFVNHKIDVLICTTIIESGLDIPNANTIIITRADRLGLAEIYQLRGRVGRSSEQAYAYLLVPSMDGLSRDAQRRLRALMDYNELGGGFKLAMSDLQIRGGGNILGESQSGNIAAVGYDLYLDLLQKTVEDLKHRQNGGEGEALEEEIEPEINLRLPAYIPENYIKDTDLRYITYRKITSCRGDEAIADIKDELRDRYGALPEETINLLGIISLKEEMGMLKIIKLDQGEGKIVLSFAEQTPVDPMRLFAMVSASPRKMKLTPDSRLVINIKSDQPETVVEEIRKTLHGLLRDAT